MKIKIEKKTLTAFEAQKIRTDQQLAVKGGTDGGGSTSTGGEGNHDDEEKEGFIGSEDIAHV